MARRKVLFLSETIIFCAHFRKEVGVKYLQIGPQKLFLLVMRSRYNFENGRLQR